MKIHTIAVIGLGRIGLPQALLLANAGFTVYGYDRNDLDKDYFSQGKTPFFEPQMDQALHATLYKTFFPINSMQTLGDQLSTIDAVFFTIGTNVIKASDVDKKKSLDFSQYYALFDDFFAYKHHFKKGLHIVIRTTMPLGGTDQLKNHIEKKYALKEGKDFFMTFAPERITEGKAFSEFKTLPIILGSYQKKAVDTLSELFSHFSKQIICVSNPKTAEFCKLTDNAYRNTLFSFANEIALYANRQHIDGYEVITTINDHYERNHIPQPGFVSGYCLSKDPYIFEFDFLKKSTARSFHSVWYYGRKTNDYLIDFAKNAILSHIKNKKKATITVLGLSFNQAIDDFRVSHGIAIIEALIAHGIQHFRVYDPNYKSGRYTQLTAPTLKYIDYSSNKITNILFEKTNAIIICTEHSAMKKMNTKTQLKKLLRNVAKNCYLFDGWHSWSSAKEIKTITYESIGIHHD